jgi:outer membrane murein-binding lipoprotein Lpp
MGFVARRRFEVFTLSFLDVICCGFGAVVLLYTILVSHALPERVRRTDDLTGEVSKLEEEVLQGKRNLVVMRNTLQQAKAETASANSRATRLLETLQKQQEESAVFDADSLARRARIEKLKSDLKAMEEGTRRLEAAVVDEPPPVEQQGGGKVTAPRRYITGLTIKGRRVLILLDVSASMMDEDVVEVIRLRNTNEAVRRAARKWRRTLEIVDWLTAQMQAGKQYQVYGFNTSSTAILPDTRGSWLNGGDVSQQKKLMDTLDKLTPQGGTSLINAFTAARGLIPTADQVILITDGLPTQGATPPVLSKLVATPARMRFFDDASKAFGKFAPVDVVLMPMIGDNQAPYRLWGLARRTGGAFIMPSRDWP